MECFETENAKVAVARMNRWINSDPQLKTELLRHGYRPRQRFFSPRVMRVFRRLLL